jgi:large subunit ribosomal protein L17
MRHRKSRHQLNRFTSWRKATVHSLVRNVLVHETITTTQARAKAAQPLVEKLVTLAKENSLAARRKAYVTLGDHALVKRLFADIGPLFTRKNGGYTRIINLGARRGDNASVVEFSLSEMREKKIPKRPREAAQKDPVETAHEHTQVPHEKPAAQEKPKKFLGGLRKIFKKERDAL